jgi:hypothetical protein
MLLKPDVVKVHQFRPARPAGQRATAADYEKLFTSRIILTPEEEKRMNAMTPEERAKFLETKRPK